MKKGLISVIIPIYNVENYLSKCVDSVLNQTYQNLEIILVDDGSKDNCGQICDEYAQKDNRVKVVHKPNGGVSQARNVGLDNSNGEFIAFVDPDDYIEKDMLSELKQNLEDADLSACGCQKIFENKVIEQLKVKKSVLIDKQKFIKNLFYNGEHKYQYQGFLWDKLYKSKIIKQHNIRFKEEIKYNEDRLFVYEYINKCDKGVFISNYIGYNYYQRDNSAMMQKEYKKEMYTEFIAFDKMSEIACQNKEFKTNDCIRTEYVLRALDMYIKYCNCASPEMMKYKQNAQFYTKDVLLSTNIVLKAKLKIIKRYLKIMYKTVSL